MNRLFPAILLLFVVQLAFAQPFSLDSACRIISSDAGDNLFPRWSDDGTRMLFQSNRNGNWDVFAYDFAADTLLQLTSDTSNEQHPVWLPNSNAIVFDSDRRGGPFLYKMDLTGGEVKPLFKRKILCRQASFPTESRLVYFSGFDDRTSKWAIYSYDFRSDNLNKLTELSGDCFLPDVSPDGKHILFQRRVNAYPYDHFAILNWYGNPEMEIDSLQATNPVWGLSGLKIYFVSTRDGLEGEVYSIWKNGSHLERLTRDTLETRVPAVSPDGSSLAVPVRRADGFVIVILVPEE